jgi:protein TonB
MEPKKNPKVDIHKKRSLIFNFSLALSLFVVVCAFNVAFRVNEDGIKHDLNITDDAIAIVPVTYHKTQQAQSEIKPKKLTNTHSSTEFKVAAATASVAPELAPLFNFEQSTVEPVGPIEVEILKELTDSVFVVVETMPEPIGGYQKFRQTIVENVRYPAAARRSNAMGKVFIQFTVNENADLTNFKTVKGIGYGCDEEAIRVLKLTQWKPGKQRGKPVKVKLVQQVSFQLAE